MNEKLTILAPWERTYFIDRAAFESMEARGVPGILEATSDRWTKVTAYGRFVYVKELP